MKWSLGCRTFAVKPDDVKVRVGQVEELFNRALNIKKEGGGKPFFEKLFCSVWAEQRYFKGEADCGQTYNILKEKFGEEHRIKIKNFEDGDLFVSILNHMFFQAAHEGNSEILLIISPDAATYLNIDILQEMNNAFKDGARASGLAITELQESILKGRLANTFAAWDVETVITHGGFDTASKMKPRNDLTASIKKGFDAATGEPRYYAYHGVEEIRLLAEIVNVYGRCIAPIMPTDNGKKQYYELPTDRKLLERHLNKMATKKARQDSHLLDAGYHVDILEYGVMPKYLHEQL